MEARGDPVQLAAEADDQEEPHGEQHLDDLGEEVHAVGLGEERALHADRGQAGKDHAEARRDRDREQPPRVRSLGERERQEHHGRAEGGQLGQKGQPGVHGNPLMNGTEAVLMTSKRIEGKSPNSTITAARIMRGTPSRNGMSFRCANFSLAGP